MPGREQSLQRYARLAGILFLLLIALAGAASMLIARFMPPHAGAGPDATAEIVIRVALLLQIAGGVATIFLAGALYALLRHFNQPLALFALLLRTIEAAFGSGLTTVFLFLELHALKIPGGAAALVASYARGRIVALWIAVLFFSVGSTLFFRLLRRSRLIPVGLATFGFFASLLVAGMVVAALVIPSEPVQLQILWLPALAAEVGTGLWLIVRGVDLGSPPEADAAAVAP